ncbi:hypothetical protein BpHYR1_007157 [Brachionus plicatilis]|uniref:Uncharacterized protein n=1 Tax=Brachionus plicatilis TaxID=10195 RepID=A0A3M7QC19_BRAPC|nr:hypothetical protein BpHYR1_007157 [Brachionus plicatilis]
MIKVKYKLKTFFRNFTQLFKYKTLKQSCLIRIHFKFVILLNILPIIRKKVVMNGVWKKKIILNKEVLINYALFKNFTHFPHYKNCLILQKNKSYFLLV